MHPSLFTFFTRMYFFWSFLIFEKAHDFFILRNFSKSVRESLQTMVEKYWVFSQRSQKQIPILLTNWSLTKIANFNNRLWKRSRISVNHQGKIPRISPKTAETNTIYFHFVKENYCEIVERSPTKSFSLIDKKTLILSNDNHKFYPTIVEKIVNFVTRNASNQTSRFFHCPGFVPNFFHKYVILVFIFKYPWIMYGNF